MSITVYQLDAQRCLLHSLAVAAKGHLQVLVAPPAVPAGHVARWITALHPVIDTKTYGDPGTGAWEVTEDHRKDKLWLGHGKPYTIGADADGQSYDGLGPVPAWLYAEEPPAPEPTLAEAQAAKIAEINGIVDAGYAALTEGYSQGEKETWPSQQAEAEAWAEDADTPTPYLDGLADRRGIEREDMRQRTLTQVQLFKAASQDLVGIAQRLRDQVYAAETVEDVSAVVWPSGGEA